ncbi:MAG: macro domain-containing protein [Porticoccaceae bacterium]|nr:MAG: macro domain-containing protein [Porticoccaceae bacterium]
MADKRALLDRLEVVEGDITRLPVDAVVNAANERLAGGGGVDGAIHRAAGREALQAACRAIGHCPTGDVRVTPGFALPARYIIHAVGPVWRGGTHGEAEQLASCYRRALEEADRLGVSSIAFPAISCGAYGYPPERAVPVAVEAVLDALARLAERGRPLPRVIFCCFEPAMAERYRRHLAALGA